MQIYVYHSTMKEKWKPVKDYEDHYEVSNTGKIRSLPYQCRGRWGIANMKGKEIKPVEHKQHGYAIVSLAKNTEKKAFRFHRIVAEAFCDNSNRKPCVNHINGNKMDNRASNLEWVTNAENSAHAKRTGLLRPVCGDAHPFAKLSKSQVAEIKRLLKHKGTLAKDIALNYLVSRSTISDIKHGRTWRNA